MIISLLYHDVVPPGEFASSGFPDGDANIYKLEQPEFELHLSEIERAPERGGIALLDGAAREVNHKDLLFTFDDGGASSLSIATLLESYGWRGHFFIPTDYIGKQGFLHPEQIRELDSRGHIVGSHSCSHPARISHCSQEQLQREWSESVRILSNLCGSPVKAASVPGGFYSRRVAKAAAAAGIEVLFNSEPISSLKSIHGCTIVGRYSIQQGVSPTTAARIASGEWGPRLRQYLFWNSKRVAKRVGGNYYLALRKSLLRNTGAAR